MYKGIQYTCRGPRLIEYLDKEELENICELDPFDKKIERVMDSVSITRIRRVGNIASVIGQLRRGCGNDVSDLIAEACTAKDYDEKVSFECPVCGTITFCYPPREETEK